MIKGIHHISMKCLGSEELAKVKEFYALCGFPGWSNKAFTLGNDCGGPQADPSQEDAKGHRQDLMDFPRDWSA